LLKANVETPSSIAACIYDAARNNVRQCLIEAGGISLDLHELAFGIYFLKIAGEGYNGFKELQSKHNFKQQTILNSGGGK
jgi:hypothetical protein